MCFCLTSRYYASKLTEFSLLNFISAAWRRFVAFNGIITATRTVAAECSSRTCRSVVSDFLLRQSTAHFLYRSKKNWKVRGGSLSDAVAAAFSASRKEISGVFSGKRRYFDERLTKLLRRVFNFAAREYFLLSPSRLRVIAGKTRLFERPLHSEVFVSCWNIVTEVFLSCVVQ